MAITALKSKIITDTGISFGDEGKGRLIHEITAEICERENNPKAVAMVAKINGGANSGHTAAGLKLNLLPCGVAEKNVAILGMGMGVVADPRKLFWEAKPLEKKGYAIFSRLLIDERCMLSDLSHRLLDLAWENYRLEVLIEAPRGSTGRGITPAYNEETSQFQIFYADFLADKDSFARKMRQRFERALATTQYVCQVTEATWDSFFTTLTQAELRANAEAIEMGVYPESEFDFAQFKGDAPFTLEEDKIIDVYWELGQQLRERIGDIRRTTRALQKNGDHILCEFGQSYWLDKRHGFPPNVTASHAFAPEVFQSLGLPIQPIHNVGVCKAYDTKVGTHTFLTQFPEDHALGQRLSRIEFGTSTGRQRMVGWFDAVEKGDAIRFGGAEDIMINKIDVLNADDDWSGDLLICTHYEDAAGKLYHHVPRNEALRKTLKPVYLGVPAWTEDISSIRFYEDLPEQAKAYIYWMVKATLDIAFEGHIPEMGDIPNVRYIGVGPDPNQIISDVPATRTLLEQVPVAAL